MIFQYRYRLLEYQKKTIHLTVWFNDDNLSLNVIKTKEMIVDYRKSSTVHAPILIDGL